MIRARWNRPLAIPAAAASYALAPEVPHVAAVPRGAAAHGVPATVGARIATVRARRKQNLAAMVIPATRRALAPEVPHVAAVPRGVAAHGIPAVARRKRILTNRLLP